MTRVARLIKKYHWNDWTIKQVKDAMLWYALYGGYIHVRGKQGDSILLTRRLSHIGQRLQHEYHDGKIIWIEFFFCNDPISAIHLILKGIEIFKDKVDVVAFHDQRDENPLTYKAYPPRLILKFLEELYGRSLRTTS